MASVSTTSMESMGMETLDRRPSASTVAGEQFQQHAYVEVADDTVQEYEAFKARAQRRELATPGRPDSSAFSRRPNRRWRHSRDTALRAHGA